MPPVIPLAVKATELLVFTIICIFVFSRIYNKVFKRSLEDSIYLSAMNQSLSGGGTQPTETLEKFVISFQCMLAFLLSSGMIIISLNW